MKQAQILVLEKVYHEGNIPLSGACSFFHLSCNF